MRKTTLGIALALAVLGATLLPGSGGATHRRYTVTQMMYVQTTAGGSRAAAKALGIHLIVAPFINSPQGWVRYVKATIARHVDALVTDGYNPATIPLLTRVRKAGILLVSSGDDIAAKRALWVNSSDPVTYAHALADALAVQIHRKGEYAILVEKDEAPIADEWAKVVERYIPKAYPGMKLDAVLTETGAGDQVEADSIKAFMADHPNLKGLIGIVPTEAYMAAAAIQQAGRIGQIFSAGNGGSDLKGTPLIGWIRGGAMVDVVAGDPAKLGYLTIWGVHYLLTGHRFRPGAYQVGGPVGLAYYYAKHQELRLGQPLVITKKNVGRYGREF